MRKLKILLLRNKRNKLIQFPELPLDNSVLNYKKINKRKIKINSKIKINKIIKINRIIKKDSIIKISNIIKINQTIKNKEEKIVKLINKTIMTKDIVSMKINNKTINKEIRGNIRNNMIINKRAKRVSIIKSKKNIVKIKPKMIKTQAENNLKTITMKLEKIYFKKIYKY